tara:strand:+ start:7286 stop:15271 length:7986 start_codon:yes stop_codon:yes gene_type:complete
MANGLNDNNQDPVKQQGSEPFTMSEKGLKKILEFETHDLSQTLEAYPDPGQEGGYSIGGGTKSFEGEKITEEEALRRFHEYVNDVAIPETAALFKNWETIPHHKREAIVNFAYNFGLTRFTDPKRGFTNFIDAVNNDDWERASREVVVNKQGLPNIYSKTHSKRAQWISSEMIRDARITSQYTPEELAEMERLYGSDEYVSTKDPDKTTQQVRDEMRRGLEGAQEVVNLVGTGEPVDPKTLADLDRTEEMLAQRGRGIDDENRNVRNWYNESIEEENERIAAAGTIDPNYKPRGKFLNSKNPEYRLMNPIKKHERFIKDVRWNYEESPNGFAEIIMKSITDNNKDTVGNIRLGGIISRSVADVVQELEKTNFFSPNLEQKKKEDIVKTLIYQDFSFKLGGFDPDNEEHIKQFSVENGFMEEILNTNLYDYYLDNMASAYEAYENGTIPRPSLLAKSATELGLNVEEKVQELTNEQKDQELEKLMELKPFALYPNKEAVDDYVKRVAPHEGKEMGEGWWSATNNQWAYKVGDLANISAPVVVAGKPGQSYDMHWSSEMGAWMTIPLQVALAARSLKGAGTVGFNTLVGDAVLSVLNPREPNIANMIREMGGARVVSSFIGEGVGKHIDEFLSDNAVLKLMSNKAEDVAFKRAFAGAIEGEAMSRIVPKALGVPLLVTAMALTGIAKGSIKSAKAGGQLIDYVVSELKLDPEAAKRAKAIYAANAKKIINKAYSIGSLDMFFDHIHAASKAIKGSRKGKGSIAAEYHETIRDNIDKIFDSAHDGAYKALSVVNSKINDLLTGRQDLVGTKEELKQLRLTQAAMYQEMAERGIPIGRASGQRGAGREGIYHLYDSWNQAVHGLREMESLLENNNWRKRQHNPQKLTKAQIERSISRLESAMNVRRQAIKNQNLIDPEEWRKFDPNESLYDFLERTEGYYDLRKNKSAFEYRQSMDNLHNARKNQGGFVRFGGGGKGEPIKLPTAKEIEMQSFSDEAIILREAAEFDIEFEAKFELKKSELVDEYVDVFGVSKSAANKKNKTQLSEELAEHTVRESREMARITGGVSPWDVARTAANKKKLKPIEEKINSLSRDGVKKAAAERGIPIEGKTALETKEAVIVHDYIETLEGKAKAKYLEKIKSKYPEFESKFKDKPKEVKPEKTAAQREADYERPIYNHLESSPEDLREIAESRGLMITGEVGMFTSPAEIAKVLNNGAMNLEESFTNIILQAQKLELDAQVNNFSAKTRMNKLVKKQQQLAKKLKEEGYTDEQIEELGEGAIKRFGEGERYVPLKSGVSEEAASRYAKLGLEDAGINLLDNIINNDALKNLWPWNYRALDPTERGAKTQLKELVSLIGVPIGKNNKLWKEKDWYDVATKAIDDHVEKVRSGEFAEELETKVDPATEPKVEAVSEPKQTRTPKLSAKEQDVNAKQAEERRARIEDAEETKEFNNLENFDTAEQAAKSLQGIEDKLNRAARRMITTYQRWVAEGSQPSSVEAARFESAVMLYQRQKAKQEILQHIIDGTPEAISGKQKVIRQMLPPSAKATDDQMVEWSKRNRNKGRYSAEHYVKFFGDVLVKEADEYGTPSSDQVKALRDLFDTDTILKDRSVNRKISWQNPFLSAPRIQAAMLSFGNSGLVSSIGTLSAAATGGGIFKYPRYWWDKVSIRALANDANPIASNEVRVWAKNYLKFFDEVSQDPRFDDIRPIMGRKYKELKKQYNLPLKSEYSWLDRLLRLLVPATDNQARAKTFEELTGKTGQGKVVDVNDPSNPPIEMFNNPALDVPVHGITNPTMIIAEMDKSIKKDILMVLASIQELSARHGMANTVDRFTKGFGGKPHMAEILKEITGMAMEQVKSGKKVLDINSEEGMDLVKEMFFALQEWNQLRAQGILGQNVSQDAWMKNRMGLWASSKEIPKEGTPEFDIVNSSPYAMERYKEYVGLEVIDSDVATANKNVLELMYAADNRARSRMEELTMQNEDYGIAKFFANVSTDRNFGFFGRFGRTAANTMTFGTERIPILGQLQEYLFRDRFDTSPAVKANALGKLQASMAIIGIGAVINRNVGYKKDETEIVGYDEQGKPIKEFVQRAFTTVPSRIFPGQEDVALQVRESVEDCKEYFLKRWSQSPEMLDYKIKNDGLERGDYSYMTETKDAEGKTYYIVTKEQKDAWIEDRVWAFFAPAKGGGSTMTFDRAGAASNMLFSGVRTDWAINKYSPRFKSKELLETNFVEDVAKLSTNVYYENISSFPFDLAMNIYDFGNNASLDNLFSSFMNDAVLTPSVGLYKDVTDTRGNVVYDTKGMSKTMAQIMKAPIVEYGVFGFDPTVDRLPVHLNYISLPVGKDEYTPETFWLGKKTVYSDTFDKLVLDLDLELLQPYEPKFNTGGAHVLEDINLRDFEMEIVEGEEFGEGNIFNGYEWYHTSMGDLKIESNYLADQKVYNKVAADPKINHLLINNKKTVNLMGEVFLYTLTDEFISDYNAAMRIKGWDTYDIGGEVTKHTLINPLSNSTKTWTDKKVWDWAKDKNNKTVSDQERFDLTTLIANKKKSPEPYEKVMSKYRRQINRDIYDDGLNARNKIETQLASIRTRFTDKTNSVITNFSNRNTQLFASRFGWVKQVTNKDGESLDEVLKARLNDQTGTVPRLESMRKGRLNQKENDYTIEVFNE